MDDDSDHELEQMQQYRMREASHPNADLFEEGDELQIVLKPVVKKVKSHDVHAYDCVDIWSLSRSGNKDALIEYIRDENVGTTQSVVDRKDAAGCTGLHYAVIEDHMLIIEYLLFCNAKREAQDKNGWTPLHYAASLGMLHIVNRLIRDPGSQRSVKDRVGMTPLHEAVRGNHIACVKALVEAGPSPPGAERNAISASGNTPLHLAAFLGHTDSVRFLLDSGADANIRNNYKQFAMDIAKTEEIRDMLMVATTIKKKCCWYCCM